MAMTALVAAEEYLRSSFEGLDREFVDGEVVERTVPNFLHSKIQWILCGLFFVLSRRFALVAAAELRLALIPGSLYRLPDVSVFAGPEPVEAAPSVPPLVVVEILSPDDRMAEMLGKLREYREFGVSHVWLVDPEGRQFYVFEAGGLHPVAEFALAEYEFVIRLADLGLAAAD